MDLKVLPEALGGFKTFDVICIYTLCFFFKPFFNVHPASIKSASLVLFIVFISTILLGSLMSEFVGNSILNLVKILPIFIFSRFVIVAIQTDSGFYKKVVSALKFGFIVSLIFLFIQIVVGTEFTIYDGLSSNAKGLGGYDIRYPGIFYDSQIHGQYLALNSFVVLVGLRQCVIKKHAISYSLFVLSIFALLMAGSRSAFGGFCVGAALAFLFGGKSFRLWALAISVIAVFITITFLPSSGVVNRADNLNEDYQFRKTIWQSALRIAEQHPILGIGIGNYQNFVSIYSQDQYIENEELGIYLDQPENGYLKILVELGIVGFAFFCFLIIKTLYVSLKKIIPFGANRDISFLLAGIIAWAVSFNTVYSLFDYRILVSLAIIFILIMTDKNSILLADEKR